MNIYYLVLAQIIRFALRAVAVYLGYVGVSGEMQNSLIETVVTQIVPIILLLVSEGWSFLQKKYFPTLLETALQARPTDNIEDVKSLAATKSSVPVVY